MKKFPFYIQLNSMDCGPACLRMIAKFYGKQVSPESLLQSSGFNKEGVSLLGLSEAAEKLGFRTKGAKLTFDQLISEAPLPCILHWSQHHFVVLTPKSNKAKLTIADPAAGLITLTKDDFCEKWYMPKGTEGEDLGITLLLTPSSEFFGGSDHKPKFTSFAILRRFLSTYKQYFIQVFIALFLGSFLQSLFPILTQSIVDVGIGNRDLGFVTVILLAQLALFASRTVVDFLRSRILLHISTRINLSILSEFWIKLMRLPISYFDIRLTGDILQRLGDHQRIENFLTHSAINTAFSIINILIFSIVLAVYNIQVFVVFIIGTILYLVWIAILLKHRRNLDYKRFAVESQENSITMQLVNGMQEIKLNNAEHFRRWEWENIQSKLFRLSFKNLSLNQYQEAGVFFINEGKNIIITFLVARLVIEGELTLGAMIAVQYIIGQLNGPVNELISFLQTAQDAKISLERLNDIHQLDDEEAAGANLSSTLPDDRTIEVKNLTFFYPSSSGEPVLENINIKIPEGKITAIVGISGSGKTTLIKLLLRFYENHTGDIFIGSGAETSENIKSISHRFWRSQCGSVMQDGYIFNDSIGKNIAACDETPDHDKLMHAAQVSNILEFVESLPLGFNTRIGIEGNGISQGQRQRILIARAVYKNPQYIFFDEATNSLDVNNEKLIMENLEKFFKGKTVVIVAHRLSTVKNADNIIVLKKGHVVEDGTHSQLIAQRGEYFELVRNQLELDNQ